MSSISVEIDVDFEDYLDEIVYEFKNSNRFRRELLKAMEEEGIKVVDKNDENEDDDERCVWINKILVNYWKLTQEENDLIKKIADRF
jgi:hypothetical protein